MNTDNRIRKLSNRKINDLMEKWQKKSSEFCDKMIDAERGHERPSDYSQLTDELSLLGQSIDDKLYEIGEEKKRRMGPIWIGDLPVKSK